MKSGMKKAVAMGLSVLMTLGLTPASAFAVTGSQVAADGTYTASAAVETDDPDEWASYNVIASVTVADGKISDLTVTSSDRPANSETYFNRAYNANTSSRKGIKTVLKGTAATYQNVDSSFDTVTGATIASAAMKKAVLEALASAAVTVDKSALQTEYDADSALEKGYYSDESWNTFTDALATAKSVLDSSDTTQDAVDNALTALQNAKTNLTEKDIYVLMNIPYDVFYNTVSTTADAVSKATSKVRIADRAGASYNGSGNATNTEDVTDVAKGAQIPVKVADSSVLTTLGGSRITDETSFTFSYISHGVVTPETRTGKAALLQADDYAYYELTETPSYYLTLNADGTFTAPTDVTPVQTAVGSDDDIVYGGNWGDYQVNFPKDIADALYLDIRKDPDNAKSIASAVTITVDGNTYGLKALASIWKSSEIAWSVSDLPATNGGTLEKITVYASTGDVYEIDYDVKLAPVYSGSITAALTKLGGTVSNLPADIQNPKASVSYKKNRNTITVIDSRDVADGKFDVSNDDALEEGKEYTVTVKSDNYAPLSATATYKDAVYVLLNIPYDTFFKLISTDADTVSGATAKVRNAGVAGSVYNGEGSVTAESDVHGAKGVQFPVKVEDSDFLDSYEEVTDATAYHVYYSGRGQTTDKELTGKDALIQADDYAYYVLSETPASYLTLRSGNLEDTTEAEEVEGSVGDISYGSHWGTYLVNFQNEVKGSVAAVTVTVNGKTYGLKATDHIWRDFEIAWNPEDDLADTNGGTLNYVTVYVAPKTTTETAEDGTVTETVAQADYKVYRINYGTALKKSEDYAITAALNEYYGTVSGYPADIENPRVTVSYTVGTGRNSQTTKVIDNNYDVAYYNGDFYYSWTALDNRKTYTVTVSSDNYTDFTTTAAYTGPSYVLMNIPYDTFYGLLNTDADTVSGATAKVRNSGAAGAVYNGEGSVTAESAVHAAKGVQFPVKVEDLTALTGTEVTDETSYDVVYSGRGKTTETTVTGKDALIQADDYAYYVLTDKPNFYLTYDNNALSAASLVINEDSGSSDDITYGNHWGTYLVDFSDYTYGDVDVSAVTVTVDGKTYGLTATDHIWRSFELAWDPEGELAATNGGTLENVTVYTKYGDVYRISYNVTLKKLYAGTISATFVDSTGKVTGLPEDIENPTVTVTRAVTGSNGRTAQQAVLSGTALTDGTFEGLVPGSTYTITVSSDNYVDISASTVYKITQTAGEKEETVTMYRVYNPNSGEHFFTANTAERDNLVSLGWKDEGVAWTAPVKSNTPVYRLYNKNAGEHHYTTSAGERDALVKLGWTSEGIGWYSDDSKAVPVYRVYNPNAFANNHHYTKSAGEKNYLVSLGWNDEGIGWYAVK